MDLTKLSRYALNNGLEVIYYDIPEAKLIRVGVMVRTGSRHDPEHLSGLHHISEHLPFRGSKLFREQGKFLNKLEKKCGSIGANTSRRRTFFYVTVLKSELDFATKLIGDLSYFPLSRKKDWEIEKGVIIAEYERSLGDYGKQMLQTKHLVYYGKDSDMNKSILGTPDTIQTITVEDINKMYESNYSVENSLIIVVGKISKGVKKIVNKNFESLKLRNGINMNREAVFQNNIPTETHIKNPIYKNARLELNFPIGNLTEREHCILTLFSIMLSEGSSSPIFQKMRIENSLLYSFGLELNDWYGKNIFSFKADVSIKNIKQIEDTYWKACYDTVRDMQRYKFAKSCLKAGMKILTDRLTKIPDHIIDSDLNNNWRNNKERVSILNSISIEELKETADKFINRDGMISLLFSE